MGCLVSTGVTVWLCGFMLICTYVKPCSNEAGWCMYVYKHVFRGLSYLLRATTVKVVIYMALYADATLFD